MQRLRALPILTFASLFAAASGCAETTPSPSAPRAASSSDGPSCNPKVGQKAPEVHAPLVRNGHGDAKSVQVTAGKVTLVDFWATWCDPCKASFPKYEELYVKYKDRGFEVIAISVDDSDSKSAIPDWLESHGNAKFPIGWDDDQSRAACWNVKNMPTAFLIDKDGVVRSIHREWKPGSEKLLEKELRELL